MINKRNNQFSKTFKSDFTRLAGVYCLFLIVSLSGCSVMKHVPENEILYTGYHIKLKPNGKVKAKDRIKELMDQNVSPKANKSIFGFYPGLWFYYNAGPVEKKKRWFRNFLKNKLGEVPIYMSDIDAEKTAKMLKGHLINNGYFQAEVKQEVKIKGRKGEVIYTASVHRPYRLREIEYPENAILFANIDSIKRESYLKVNQRYVLERLEAEQTRIEQALENYGYYYFDDRHLLFEADSTVGDKQVDLRLILEKGVPEKAKTIYRIGEVSIFPNYLLTTDSDSVVRKYDTLKVEGYRYIDRLKRYRPEIITEVINLKKGNIYRREDREYTLGHLMSLGSFKFVDIRFRESRRDSGVLNVNIHLTPYLKKSVRAEFQMTSKSNNFVGPGLTVKFTNRNVFRGSEKFDVTLTSGYEVQVARKVKEPLNAYELGVESNLAIPRFISPFKVYYPTRKYLPTTDMKLGFRLQQRVGYFRLNSFNLGYGYSWRENTLKAHELLPADISYVKLSNTSGKFDTLLMENRYLQRSLEDQFIIGSRYAFTLNTQVNEVRLSEFSEQSFKRTDFFLNARAETAGNLVHLTRGGKFGASEENSEALKIFGSPYSQFVRGETDFRFYWRLSEKSTLASRFVVGAGYAYGNSITMPYIRQFSVGGSNSVRAFPARSVGPGTYNARTDTTNSAETTSTLMFIDQRADFKLEGSTEYRFDITRVFKGAVFLDAGNIWLWRPEESRPGGEFNSADFLSELAAGTGVGLRFDFTFFVLRLDLAMPLSRPSLEKGHRWVLDDMVFKDSRWRKDNLILNIAIGYPF
jgi:outer membrane protein insertion porin family